MSPLFLCFRLVSAASVGVQPATELRHVQRHRHEQHVSSALRACLPAASMTRPSLRAACAADARHPPASRPACRPSSHAFLSTRQLAYAFNQPLSFVTSSVTNMEFMFTVRSARAVPAASTVRSCQQPPQLGHPSACAAAAQRPRASHPLFLCLPLDSAERVGVQPAAELRHVQRHKHGRHV